MQIVKTPPSIVFCNNPVTIVLRVNEVELQKIRIRTGIESFSLSAYPTADGIVEFEVSNIIKPFINKVSIEQDEELDTDFANNPPSANFIVEYVRPNGNSSNSRSSSNSIGTTRPGGVNNAPPAELLHICQFEAYIGGINKPTLRRMTELGTNIFNYRFRNRDKNIVFTTRTSKKTITLAGPLNQTTLSKFRRSHT